MIGHIKKTAETKTQREYSSVVLGRPVNYGLHGSQSGNQQALDIMARAARKVGFSEIEFEYEPVAAALDFERKLSQESRVLVVDVGGGTTDITMMRLSPSLSANPDRRSDILSSVGGRIGGNDLDICLALYGMCRYLGKESWGQNERIINRDSPLASSLYADAMRINDLVGLANFQSSGKKNPGCVIPTITVFGNV